MKQFEIGKEYSCRSIGDYNCIWSFVIKSRTAKSVRVIVDGVLSTRRIKTYDGVETFSPFGTYSMSPVVNA